MGHKHLDAHTVATIRRRYAEGDKISHLAEHYGSSFSTVHRIVHHKTYTDIMDSAADRGALNVDRPRQRTDRQIKDKYQRLAAHLSQNPPPRA